MQERCHALTQLPADSTPAPAAAERVTHRRRIRSLASLHSPSGSETPSCKRYTQDVKSSENAPPGSRETESDLRQRTRRKTAEESAQSPRGDAGAQAARKLTAGKQRVADEIDRLSEATAAAADAYRQQDGEGLAAYAHDLSDSMARFGQRLRERNVEDLARDARRLARENPAAFLLGSVAVGFGLSRFFKASSPAAEPRRQNPPTTGGIA
jgi:hypothetical protein